MTTAAKPTATEIKILAAQHVRIIELLAQKITADAGIADIIDRADKAATLQLLKCDESLQGFIAQSTTAEAELEALARELIPDTADKRSIETPLGTLKLPRTTALVSPENGGDDAVIALIKIWDNGELGPRAKKILDEVTSSIPGLEFLRVKHELNREALERLTDEQLAVLGLLRVRTTNFSVSRKKITAANAKALLAEAREKVAAA